MIELLSSCIFLPSHAPLAAFGAVRGNWPVWAQAQATAALRGVVALAELPVDEYALHSLRIGGAVFLSAGGGASVDVVRREGRWKSDACKVCAHGVDAKVVSDILADTDAQPALQPGQKTMRDING